MHRIPSMFTISVTFKVRDAYPTPLNFKYISYLFVIQAVSQFRRQLPGILTLNIWIPA